MEPSPCEKCVIVLDGRLPPGLAANAAAILGMTLGKRLPDAVGPDVAGQDGAAHAGIVTIPVPILRGDPETLKAIRRKLRDPAYAGVTAADFSDLAQGCKTYGEYQEKMACAPEESLSYLGLALFGSKRVINRLTGCLPLLR